MILFLYLMANYFDLNKLKINKNTKEYSYLTIDKLWTIDLIIQQNEYKITLTKNENETKVTEFTVNKNFKELDIDNSEFLNNSLLKWIELDGQSNEMKLTMFSRAKENNSLIDIFNEIIKGKGRYSKENIESSAIEKSVILNESLAESVSINKTHTSEIEFKEMKDNKQNTNYLNTSIISLITIIETFSIAKYCNFFLYDKIL